MSPPLGFWPLCLSVAARKPLPIDTTKENGYFGIDAMAMAPAGTTAAGDFGITWGVNSSVTTTGADRCFNAGVNLPHGATITHLTVWTTSGGSSNPATWLYRHELSSGDAAVIATRNIVDDNATRKQTNIAAAAGSVAVVNTRAYAYGIGVCIGPGDLFHAARIRYTYTHTQATDRSTLRQADVFRSSGAESC